MWKQVSVIEFEDQESSPFWTYPWRRQASMLIEDCWGASFRGFSRLQYQSRRRFFSLSLWAEKMLIEDCRRARSVANWGGVSAASHGFDWWLSGRFPAARTAWRWPAAQGLPIGTKLDRNGRSDRITVAGRGGSGSFSLSPRELLAFLFLFSLYIKGWAKSKKIGCGCLYSKFTCSHTRMIRKIGVAMLWMFVVKD